MPTQRLGEPNEKKRAVDPMKDTRRATGVDTRMPERSDKEVQGAGVLAMLMARMRKGRRSTILTSNYGIDEAPPLSRPAARRAQLIDF